jgi:Right handed beta helix region
VRHRPGASSPSRRASATAARGAISATVLLVAWSFLAYPAAARTIEIHPAVSTTDEEFERVANTLAPGDTLVLRGGTYSQTARRAITVNGTAAAPIVIRSASGESALLTRPLDNMDTQNNIELVSCNHLVLDELRFEGGSIGVRFLGGNHITVQNCEIFGTGNNAMAMNSGSSTGLLIRHNEIHHTGLSSGTTEGEGMYVGCNNATCSITNSVFEGNYIHHLRATSDGGNDGIEIKVGSYGNIVRNNVIHDTTIGKRYPGIFVYGGGTPANIVEGNAIWNSGEAIQVVSDAVIRNNLILNSDVGITAAPHVQVSQMRNVTIVNNTIYGHSTGIRVRWTNAANMILANNAIYCPTGTAVDAAGISTSTVEANYVQGGMTGISVGGAAFVAGGTAESAFLDAPGFDFWLTSSSILRGKGAPGAAPALDFNGTSRTAPIDVGAYEREGLSENPGWRVGPGFKSGSAAVDTIPPEATRDLSGR